MHDRPQSLETQIHDCIRNMPGYRSSISSANSQKLPRIPILTHSSRLCPALQHWVINEYLVENCGAAYALMHTDQNPALSGSTGLNIFNHQAVLALSPMVGQLTLSPELSRDEIRILIHAARSRGITTRFALIVQGNSEAMISEDCILQPWLHVQWQRVMVQVIPAFTGIMDTTGHIFPVRIDGECRSHIYNAAELCLIDHLPSLWRCGIE